MKHLMLIGLMMVSCCAGFGAIFASFWLTGSYPFASMVGAVVYTAGVYKAIGVVCDKYPDNVRSHHDV